MHETPRPLIALIVLAGLSAVVSAPTLLMGAWYLHYRLTGPPSFSGDPDIGLGILLLVAMMNAPFVLAVWIGWFVWLAWAVFSRGRT